MEHYCGNCKVIMDRERKMVDVPFQHVTQVYISGEWVRNDRGVTGSTQKTVTVYTCPNCHYSVYYGYPYKIEVRRRDL